MVHGRRTTDYGHKLKQGRFILKSGLFTVTIGEHWSKLHRDCAVAILGVFQNPDG